MGRNQKTPSFSKTLLLIGLVLTNIATAWSQPPLNKSITIQYSGRNMVYALQQFETAIGASFQYSPDLLPAPKQIHINFYHVRASLALKDFLNQHGLDYEWFGGSVIIKPYNPPTYIHRFTVSGHVLDEESKERLVKAYVNDVRTGRFCLTDEFGIFKLPLESDTLIFSVYYDGFQTYLDTLIGKRDYHLEVPMKFQSQTLPTIEINRSTSNNITVNAVSKGFSDQFYISSNKLSKLPAMLGETDVLRALSMNPGVVGGSEGMLGMYVRGGSPDQNLILLDEIPVYNPYHLYGLFGTFNSDIVKSAQMFRGTMPSDLGGRLSSAINIQSIDGNPNRWTGSATLGVLSAKFHLQGPLVKDKTTLVISGRKSLLDVLTQPIAVALKNDSNSVNTYRFRDINVKIIHRFSSKNVLTLSAFENLDRASFINSNFTEKNNADIYQRNEQSNYWGNNLMSLNWELSPNPRTRISLKSYSTSYAYTIYNDYYFSARFKSDTQSNVLNYSAYKTSNNIQDLAAKFKIEKILSKQLSIKIGSEYIYHSFNPGSRQIITLIDSIDRNIVYRDKLVQTPEINAFAQLNYIGANRWFLDAGLRGSYFGMGDGQYYILPEPRGNLRFRINSNNWLKLSSSKNIQFFHLLNNIAIGLPSDIWVPSTTTFRPSSAQQNAIGFTTTQAGWQFSTELFTKHFYNLLEYKDNALYLSSILNWEETITQGDGKAQGAEFLIEKTKGKFTGWASYTLMNSSRTFKDLNHGNPFPARYDRRHNVYLVAMYSVNSTVQISANWVYNSGFAYTLPIGVYLSPTPDNPFQEILIYGDRNNARSIANHRLDVNAQWNWTRNKFIHTLNLGIYNAYNRKNPFFINVGYNEKGDRTFLQTSLLPILPQISYSLKF